MEKRVETGTRRRYDEEFKKEVLRMLESGRGVTSVAKALGIGENLVFRWRRAASKESAGESGGTAAVYDGEKALMQKRIKELEMERDILKKALAIFSRQT
jgi:transposase